MPCSMHRLRILVCAALSFVAGRAWADPLSLTGAYSGYEQQAIHDAEADLRAHLEPAPEGKAIERIDFVRLDPIDRHDSAARRASTRSTRRRFAIVSAARAARARRAEVEAPSHVDESARNLRTLPAALARAVRTDARLDARSRAARRHHEGRVEPLSSTSTSRDHVGRARAAGARAEGDERCGAPSHGARAIRARAEGRIRSAP